MSIRRLPRAMPLRLLLCALFIASVALPSRKALADDALAGDAPVAPGPRARLSGAMQRPAILRATALVAAWQYARVRSRPSLDWTFAPLYLGFLRTGELLHDPRYAAYVRGVGEHFHWILGPRVRFADDQAVAQAWLELYFRHPDPALLQPLRQRYDAQMQQPAAAKRPLWWWCDALFMAPATWAGLSKATGKQGYLDYMDRQWWVTNDLLYDAHNHLYSRDSSYLDRYEHNGKKLYWSRGNGWVLRWMPADYPDRGRYLQQFREMAQRLATLQGSDGLWRSGLLDAASYPQPEVSGSTLITYALAWGVHHHVLDAAAYTPVIRRAWRGMVGQIYADGRLGNIQPIGAAPGKYPPSSSYVYGVGAFLMAAAEVAAISGHGEQP